MGRLRPFGYHPHKSNIQSMSCKLRDMHAICSCIRRAQPLMNMLPLYKLETRTRGSNDSKKSRQEQNIIPRTWAETTSVGEFIAVEWKFRPGNSRLPCEWPKHWKRRIPFPQNFQDLFQDFSRVKVQNLLSSELRQASSQSSSPFLFNQGQDSPVSPTKQQENKRCKRNSDTTKTFQDCVVFFTIFWVVQGQSQNSWFSRMCGKPENWSVRDDFTERKWPTQDAQLPRQPQHRRLWLDSAVQRTTMDVSQVIHQGSSWSLFGGGCWLLVQLANDESASPATDAQPNEGCKTIFVHRIRQGILTCHCRATAGFCFQQMICLSSTNPLRELYPYLSGSQPVSPRSLGTISSYTVFVFSHHSVQI